MPPPHPSYRNAPGARPRWQSHACSFLALALGGCATGADAGGLADKALGLVGLQTQRGAVEPSAGDTSVPRPQRISLRIHAGDVLNSDASGKSLSLVAKVYAVKDADAFLQAPYSAFGGTGPIDGATELREIVLTPGRKYETVETLAGDVRHLAVVGLFRAPDDKRWRFAFEARTAVATGVTLGAHRCGLSVSDGEPIRTSLESTRLAGSRCQ